MAVITYEALSNALRLSPIPIYMREGLIHYVVNGYRPGHFLSAVISNDLKEACTRADDENRYRIYDYIFFLYNYAPMGCFGSKENFEAWLAIGGFNRRLEKKETTDGV